MSPDDDLRAQNFKLLVNKLQVFISCIYRCCFTNENTNRPRSSAEKRRKRHPYDRLNGFVTLHQSILKGRPFSNNVFVSNGIIL